MSRKPLLFLLGFGPRIGRAVAQQFDRAGYDVAVASRRGNNEWIEDGFFFIKADFSKPASVTQAFDIVRAQFGVSPTVVVFNAYSLTPPPDENSIFSISEDTFTNDLIVNTVSAYSAAREAVEGWKTLPSNTQKTFIYTGNVQNVQHLPAPLVATIGAGKSASAYWIGSVDTQYSQQGFRFFYADERKEDGSMTGPEVDSHAHAEFYMKLAAGGDDIPWHATFVKGKGYIMFQ